MQDIIKELEKVKALKEQIEFVLGATKTGLDIIDAEFNIRYIDPEWQKVYGDPAGKKCYEYFMGSKSACPQCGVLKALQTKEPVVTEEVLVKEGNRPVQVTTIPFQNEKGEWLVAEANIDISARKQMEEQLKQTTRQLQEKVETLERFQKATIDREIRMNELQKKITELEARLAKDHR